MPQFELSFDVSTHTPLHNVFDGAQKGPAASTDDGPLSSGTGDVGNVGSPGFVCLIVSSDAPPPTTSRPHAATLAAMTHPAMTTCETPRSKTHILCHAKGVSANAESRAAPRSCSGRRISDVE